MHEYEYPRPSVTVTVGLIVDGHAIVQIRRGPGDVFANYWSLPGGFLEAKTNIFGGETLEQTVAREILEELGFTIDIEKLRVLPKVYSDPNTDPRAHVVNVVFLYDITEADYWSFRPNEEVAQMRLSPYVWDDKLAFNHLEIMKDIYYMEFRNGK